MTTPVLQSLHNKYPDALFDIVTDKRSINLYENYPYLNKLYLKDKDKPLRGAPDLLFRLWKNQYDIVVDLRTDGLAYLIRSKKRYTKWGAKSYGQHAVEDLLGVIAKIHGNAPVPDTRVWLSDLNREYANKKISFFSKKDKLLALSVGDPKKPAKTWAIDKYIELINRHRNDFSGLIFLGGQSEEKSTLEVINKIDLPCINTAGNSLLEAAALLEKACLYIGPDSGLGHIASALKVPTISFFSMVKPERFRPWGNKSVCIIGTNDDARNISIDDVSTAIKGFLNE